MESNATPVRHPERPMLVVLPLGLLASSLIFDLIRIFGGDATWAIASGYAIAGGVAGGLLAAVFGPTLTTWRGLVNVAALGMFAASWVLRRPSPADPSAEALVLSGLAVLLLGVGMDGEAEGGLTGLRLRGPRLSRGLHHRPARGTLEGSE